MKYVIKLFFKYFFCTKYFSSPSSLSSAHFIVFFFFQSPYFSRWWWRWWKRPENESLEQEGWRRWHQTAAGGSTTSHCSDVHSWTPSITIIIVGDDHKDGHEGDHKYDQDESENEGGSSENLNQILWQPIIRSRPVPGRFPCCVFHICNFDICHDIQLTNKTKDENRSQLSRTIN